MIFNCSPVLFAYASKTRQLLSHETVGNRLQEETEPALDNAGPDVKQHQEGKRNVNVNVNVYVRNGI